MKREAYDQSSFFFFSTFSSLFKFVRYLRKMDDDLIVELFQALFWNN